MDFLKTEAKNIIIFVALLGGIYLAYAYYFADSGSSSAVTTEFSTQGASEVGGDILPILLQLKTIKLDLAIFDDAVFKSLKNFGVDLPYEESGRVNPFAPLEGSAVVKPATDITIKTFRN